MLKFLGLGLASSLLFAPTTGFVDSISTQNPAVSESTNITSASTFTFKDNIYEGPGTKIKIGDGVESKGGISLFSEAYKIVPVHHIGGAFNDSFTCTPSDGVNLNIWMRNNSNYSVQFQVKMNGSVLTDQTIAPGAQKTISSTDMLGVGLKESFGVYIYSKTGNSLDVDVSARQF